jgi:U2 small nuclear ribonucleoprotein B''
LQQKIQYARGKSNFIAKLDGTFVIPVPGETNKSMDALAGDNVTALQQSIFGGAPGAGKAQAGVKRSRDEDSEKEGSEEEEADMEMDESD